MHERKTSLGAGVLPTIAAERHEAAANGRDKEAADARDRYRLLEHEAHVQLNQTLNGLRVALPLEPSIQ